ncbi:imelysin family protein [Parendozoicomonas haliclonae]|uniref:Iron-regulated protein A n=1 Tax=Parendozoicomonas haliclonae TaxID=1960125 RepID=A0A1X7AQ82_9GAMM|nr:imelysin family protein [Parendozoicomonas haliclonae]SMA50258.1 Iron-regulated protein A precursor [Parendozoicomonas haliclonae]
MGVFKKTVLAVAAASFLAGCSQEEQTTQAAAEVQTEQTVQTENKIKTADVINNYADLAHATFADSLKTAKELRTALQTLVDNPTQENLDKAQSAWLAARVPYQQSEVYRFGNPVVDDWEGQLNAWPLDEGLIDYVDAGKYDSELGNVGATANIIANTSLNVGTENLDISSITPELLASLNELGGSEANVATGYHAIEFLLWGQDLNGTEAGAGQRSVSDYAKGDDCTNGNCERRGEYLIAAADLLVADLEYMVGQWEAGSADNYRQTFIALKEEESLRRMLFGMGSLALGELAGERMKVALEAGSTEDEHDCFSDNTHNSHFYNAKGIQNVFTGSFTTSTGDVVSGPSLQDMLGEANTDAQNRISGMFGDSEKALMALVESAENGQAFDQLIAAGNDQGNALVKNAIDALVQETSGIEELARTIGIQNLNPDTADHTF